MQFKLENKYAYAFIIFGFMVVAYVLYSELYLSDPRIFKEQLIKHVHNKVLNETGINLELEIQIIGKNLWII